MLQQCTSLVNYIKRSVLYTRIFKELYEDTDAKYNVLLYQTKVRWLSKGNMTARAFQLRNEIKNLCDKYRKTDFMALRNHSEWQLSQAYFVDNFEQLNNLPCKVDTLTLPNW